MFQLGQEGCISDSALTTFLCNIEKPPQLVQTNHEEITQEVKVNPSHEETKHIEAAQHIEVKHEDHILHSTEVHNESTQHSHENVEENQKQDIANEEVVYLIKTEIIPEAQQLLAGHTKNNELQLYVDWDSFLHKADSLSALENLRDNVFGYRRKTVLELILHEPDLRA